VDEVDGVDFVDRFVGEGKAFVERMASCPDKSDFYVISLLPEQAVKLIPLNDFCHAGYLVTYFGSASGLAGEQ
jgi:hypothetical protein